MKKFLVLIFLGAIVASCAPKFEIKGFIDGLSGPVYLSYVEGKKAVVKDSTMAINGKFSFEGQLERPIFAQIHDNLDYPVANFFLENSKIKINGMVLDLDSVKVNGSEENDTYHKAIQNINSVRDMVGYSENMKKHVVSNPDKVWAAYLLFFNLAPSLNYNELRTLADGFDANVKQSPYIALTLERANILEATASGRKFTDFTATDTTGQPIKLSSVAGQGKWVLLNFWASWSGASQNDNGYILNAYEKYNDKGFTIFSLSLDNNDFEWRQAIDDYYLTWTHARDLVQFESAAADLYGVTQVPSNVLISPDGTIYARNVMKEELHAVLENVLK